MKICAAISTIIQEATASNAAADKGPASSRARRAGRSAASLPAVALHHQVREYSDTADPVCCISSRDMTDTVLGQVLTRAGTKMSFLNTAIQTVLFAAAARGTCRTLCWGERVSHAALYRPRAAPKRSARAGCKPCAHVEGVGSLDIDHTMMPFTAPARASSCTS